MCGLTCSHIRRLRHWHKLGAFYKRAFLVSSVPRRTVDENEDTSFQSTGRTDCERYPPRRVEGYEAQDKIRIVLEVCAAKTALRPGWHCRKLLLQLVKGISGRGQASSSWLHCHNSETREVKGLRREASALKRGRTRTLTPIRAKSPLLFRLFTCPYSIISYCFYCTI